jgi:hypothetical protein
VSPAPTGTQKLAVWLAFTAAAVSFLAVGIRYAEGGRIDVTPLFGGIVMLVLAMSGYRRLKNLDASR